MQGENRMADFRNSLDNIQLHDLGFSGPIFTWNNGRENLHRIWEMLDRVVANEAWKERYQNFSVRHGISTFYDHIPLFINTAPSSDEERTKSIFRFETFWV